jgi:hypothetical protein
LNNPSQGLYPRSYKHNDNGYIIPFPKWCFGKKPNYLVIDVRTLDLDRLSAVNKSIFLCQVTARVATVTIKFSTLFQIPCEREYKYFDFPNMNLVAGTCESGNEPSGSIKCGELLDYLKTD